MKKTGTWKEAKGRGHISVKKEEKVWQIPRAEMHLMSQEYQFWKTLEKKGQGMSLETQEYGGTCRDA